MDTEFNSCRCLAALVGSRKKMAANAVLTADEERELQDGLHEIAAIEKSEQSLWQGGWSKEQQQQKQRPRQGDEDEYIQHAQQRLNQVSLVL